MQRTAAASFSAVHEPSTSPASRSVLSAEAISAGALASVSARLSVRRTAWPPSANTSAMPCPMMPAPRTAISLMACLRLARAGVMDNARPPRKPERPRYLGMRHRPRGPVGPSYAVGKSRGVGRRTTHIYFLGAFRRPRGSLERSPCGASQGPAPRVRIAPARSAFFSPRPPRLVGGRVSAPDPGLARGLSPGEVGRVRPSPDPLPALQGSPAVVRGGRIRRRWSSIREGRRIGLGLPSPVDAFHRPQAPAPPHVTIVMAGLSPVGESSTPCHRRPCAGDPDPRGAAPETGMAGSSPAMTLIRRGEDLPPPPHRASRPPPGTPRSSSPCPR